jgi:lysophospholipid acyltransferase (LPLAT)-like uncharacterized protein
MAWWKRVGEKPAVQRAAGALIAGYLRLVWKTSRFVIEPADAYERIAPHMPFILAMWHGQHFLMPFTRRQFPAKVLISRHRDGALNAIVAERLGVGTIRGSGDLGREFDRKGGVPAFKAMLTALDENWNMALTADVPKISRVAGRGIIMLARASGRPILPVAIATSHRIEFNNWDRSALNLPFSRGAIVAAEPVEVAQDADDATIEAARRALEAKLNDVTARAYAIADRRAGAA